MLLVFSTIFCYLLLDFHVKTGTRFSLQDKRLFEISKVKITRVGVFCTVTYIVGANWNDLSEVILMNTHKICFDAKTKKKYCLYILFSGAVYYSAK